MMIYKTFKKHMHLFFDALIFCLLAFGVVVQLSLFALEKDEIISRADMLIVFIFILACQLLVLYGSFIEPNQIAITNKKIALPNIVTNQGQASVLRIVFVSDLHAGPFKREAFFTKMVQKLNALDPDIVFIAGDFVYNSAAQVKYLAPLRDIKTKYGVFGVLGNHDYDIDRFIKDYTTEDERAEKLINANKVSEYLENLGINILRNEKYPLALPDVELNIFGMEDLWAAHPDETAGLFNEIAEAKNVILLQHNPDIILDKRSLGAELILSGHTHAGQIKLPILGPIANPPTKMGRKYHDGFYELSPNKPHTSTVLFVSKGIGEVGPRSRLFNRPEIVILTCKLG